MNNMSARREGLIDSIDKTAPDEIADTDDSRALLKQVAPFGDGARAVHPARIIAEVQRKRHIVEFTTEHIDHYGTIVHFDQSGTMVPCKLQVTACHRFVSVAFPPVRFCKRLKANSLEGVFDR